MILHVVAHTHWDREWHKTFQEYRVKLIRFFDDLIELLYNDENFTSFMLDGQTIILEDYLEIKPYMKEKIKDLIKKGKLVIGPWYVQPDEFIPSGESLIRNLILGEKIGSEFGKVMNVGYLPDSFGQAAQIPQILKGFEIDYAVFWRGLTEYDIYKTEFLWQAPDKSKIFAVHLPLGYGNARNLSNNLIESIKIIDENIDKLKDRATTSNLLLMSGFDQSMANHDLTLIIEELNKYYKGITIKLSSLIEYIECVRKEISKIETLEGEFRKGKNMRVHVSIDATRMDIKKDNFTSQILYEKYLERICSLTYTLNNEYEKDLIQKGWKYIIQNHAHDSICCVCTDDTHEEMKLRYKYAQQIGNCIINENINFIVKNIRFKTELGKPLLVLNSTTNSRKDIVNAVIYVENENFVLLDQYGKFVPYQIEEIKEINMADKIIEIGYKNPDKYYKEVKIAFIAELDGFGFKTYYIKEYRSHFESKNLIGSKNVLENEFLKITVKANGSLEVKDKRTNKIYDNLNVFEESGNAGDEYDYSPPKEDLVITTYNSNPKIDLIENGPIKATIRIKHILNLPIDTDAKCRSKEEADSIIENHVTLYRDLDRIEFKTIIDNKVKNHRIRALFESNVNAEKHIAQQHFGVIERKNYLKEVEIWDKEKWEEKYYPIYPQQYFIDVSDDFCGLAILNKGLPQYEILNNNKPVIALTLLYGTDYMGKSDLIYRPGRRSGLHIKTNDSLLLGTFETEYAIIPHGGDYITGVVALKAENYVTPFKAFCFENINNNGFIEDEFYLFKTKDNFVITSAIKVSEDGEGVIWRLYNSTNKRIENVNLHFNNLFYNIVQVVNLREHEIFDNRVKIEGSKINIDYLNSNEIVTLKFIINKNNKQILEEKTNV
ncbi:Alpha-mannosidase [Caloramator australicus RC3]|uniref:Alpha-mannosidase n=1 Tax=Caloramator australicus RC3 TaxID=857293 RepID=I7J4X4_9CLOT|nr:glycoside hydrolase family 38 C-terminal domain-containing protein [Caloramator australicus]CCJ33191.1 Alpha-mannosidase [Caloramator australicus RC3]